MEKLDFITIKIFKTPSNIEIVTGFELIVKKGKVKKIQKFIQTGEIYYNLSFNTDVEVFKMIQKQINYLLSDLQKTIEGKIATIILSDGHSLRKFPFIEWELKKL